MHNTEEIAVNAEDHRNEKIGGEDPETKSTRSLTRRSFLARTGVSSVVVAAASAGLPSLLPANAEGQVGGSERADRSFQLRFNAASRERNVRPRSTTATRPDTPTLLATILRDFPMTASAKWNRRPTRPC